MNITPRTLAYVIGGLLPFAAGWVVGQALTTTEKSVMHVVAFTVREEATPQDISALQTATAAFVGTVPGLKRAWVGKLRQPLVVGTDTRTHGLILEFDDLKSREAYSTHPNRKVWATSWDKVRKTGTNFDVIGGSE